MPIKYSEVMSEYEKAKKADPNSTVRSGEFKNIKNPTQNVPAGKSTGGQIGNAFTSKNKSVVRMGEMK